jgi:high-affinity iron transporter
MGIDFSAALPTFIVTLREGVEAALVVGITLALLQKAQQSRLVVWVYLGVLGGMVSSIGLGFGLQQLLLLLHRSQSTAAIILLPALNTLFTVTAIAMLTWMLFWMAQQSKSLKTDIEAAVQQAIQSQGLAAWGLSSLAFVAVLREGLEIALFTVTQLQQGWMPVFGAIAGLTGALGIGWSLFRLGLKINLKQFFQIMGMFLLLIVAGLLIAALKQFDATLRILDTLDATAFSLCLSPPTELTSCLLGPLIWNAHTVLPDNQFPGIFLKSLLGYRDRVFLAQIVAYLVFLIFFGGFYLKISQSRKNPEQTPAPAATNMVKESP